MAGDEKVVVVSIVGHSELQDNGNKTDMLTQLLGCSMSHCTPIKPLTLPNSLVTINIFLLYILVSKISICMH